MIDVKHQISAVPREVGTKVLEAGEARVVTVSQSCRIEGPAVPRRAPRRVRTRPPDIRVNLPADVPFRLPGGPTRGDLAGY